MGLQLQVKWPDSLKGKGKIAEVEAAKNSILMEGGYALQEVLADWMREVEANHPSRFGKRLNHFTPDGVLDPVVEGNSVAVPITIAGITRALHDLVIRPVEAKMLAIPLHADAYGIQPREWNDKHPKGSEDALFRPKGKDWLARKGQNGSLVLMYALKNEVTQPRDETLLPPADKMANAVIEAMGDAIEAILNS